MPRPAALAAATACALAIGLGAGACTADSRPMPPAPSRTSATATTVAAPATSAPSPSATAVWPTAIPEVDAMSSPHDYTVVWLAVAVGDATETLDPALAGAARAGYDVTTTAVDCVDPAPGDLVGDRTSDVWGVPLYFATRADADRFVALWATPVVTVVDDVHLACDWD